MKKKLRNPVYARLNEKINDLRAQAEQYSDKSMVDNILAFLQTHEVVSRSEIDKLAGGKIGVYHIANEIRKLTRVQARVPAFV